MTLLPDDHTRLTRTAAAGVLRDTVAVDVQLVPGAACSDVTVTTSGRVLTGRSIRRRAGVRGLYGGEMEGDALVGDVLELEVDRLLLL